MLCCLTLLFWLAALIGLLRLRGDIPPFVWPEWRERLEFHGWMVGYGFLEPWLRFLRMRDRFELPQRPNDDLYYYPYRERGCVSWWWGSLLGNASIGIAMLAAFILFLMSIAASV